VQPVRAENLIPSARPALASCTGRAVSVRRGGAAPAALAGAGAPAGTGRAGPPVGSGQADATILIVGPGCWPSAGQAIAAVAGREYKAVISAELGDFLRYNLIKTGIVPARVNGETVAALQALVESDPGILLTVDIGRREVRARGDLAARFEMDDGAEDMARRLQITQRLIGSAGLAADTRIRLQRRLIALCDAMKSPGADTARSAWRLDLLLADLARSGETSQGGGIGAAMAGGQRNWKLLIPVELWVVPASTRRVLTRM
jgi:hypothetical protein